MAMVRSDFFLKVGPAASDSVRLAPEPRLDASLTLLTGTICIMWKVPALYLDVIGESSTDY